MNGTDANRPLVNDPLLTAPEVAARLRIARSTVYELARTGELPSSVVMRSHGRAMRRWQVVDVERFIAARRELSEP